MKVVFDTNVLIRAVVDDDPVQSPLARKELLQADEIALSTASLCEFVWVLRTGYRRSPESISAVLKDLIQVPGVDLDRLAIEAGLTNLDAGGDFADGVIAFEGRKLGASLFVSFDQKAVRLIGREGGARLPLDD